MVLHPAVNRTILRSLLVRVQFPELITLNAGIAQQVEQLPCKQKVTGSIPVAGTSLKININA